MKTVVVVPIHTLADAKSRLRASLDDSARRDLVLWLGARVVAAAHASAGVARVAVVSPDADVLAWAGAVGAVPLRQLRGDLNDGLEVGRVWALREHADAILVLLGDLPRLTTADVDALLRVASTEHGREPAHSRLVVLAPDRAERGTNGLLVTPVAALPFGFGEGSLARHLAAARQAELDVRLLRVPGLAFDVDTPDELAEIIRRGLWTAAPTSRSHDDVDGSAEPDGHTGDNGESGRNDQMAVGDVPGGVRG